MTAAWLLVALLACAAAADAAPPPEVTVASKKFTESVILAEIVAGLLESQGVAVERRRDLGGTRILWSALLRGDIDVYPEYTGTLSGEILAGRIPVDADWTQLARALDAHGVGITKPLGFANNYALGMRRDGSERKEITAISDLRAYPDLKFGFSNEFMDRADGWRGLRRHYRLPQRAVGLDHDLAYRGLADGALDVIDLYTTDAEIAYYDIALLQDDREYFKHYEAVLVYRRDLPARQPRVQAALARLPGSIDAARMIAMNGAVKLRGRSERRVAAAFLRDELQIDAPATESSAFSELAQRTREHLVLVGISLSAAIGVAVPLGILAVRCRRLGQLLLAATGVLQTIPSLALLVFMIPLFGIGAVPAIVALFLYSLLPILRNTHAGLSGIPGELLESADALGLPRAARLRRIELPLALATILAGIKTSAVINVGTATLGALIGAGGYGQPILTGIRLDDTALILQGAVPAAVLALSAQALFDLIERAVTPRGLRL